jgi:negative regulator of flagellin synthesis FlgM
MQISSTSHVHAPHGINAPHAPFRGQSASSAPASTGVDRVEISPAAQAAIDAADAGEVRAGLVNQIRAQIANGTYETPAKMDIALDRLLDEIG